MSTSNDGDLFACVGSDKAMKVFDVNGPNLNVYAAGHLSKNPMLMIFTASTTMAGTPHVKKWKVVGDDGLYCTKSITTAQPEVVARSNHFIGSLVIVSLCRCSNCTGTISASLTSTMPSVKGW